MLQTILADSFIMVYQLKGEIKALLGLQIKLKNNMSSVTRTLAFKVCEAVLHRLASLCTQTGYSIEILNFGAYKLYQLGSNRQISAE